MSIKAIKMHGQGNDYIFLDLLNEQAGDRDWGKIAIELSDRHFGIGSDGLILLTKFVKYKDSYISNMQIFNADGSEAETCGTALRCAAFYLHQKCRINEVYLNTLSGIKHCLIDEESGEITVNMGKAVIREEMSITVEGMTFTGYFVNIGNPHFCIFENEALKNDDAIWEKIETHPAFPDKTNVENIYIINDSEINIKIWERGSGFTLACGSGACASAFVANKFKGLADNMKVNVPGGEVIIRILDDDNCLLIGKVVKVFETEITILGNNEK